MGGDEGRIQIVCEPARISLHSLVPVTHIKFKILQFLEHKFVIS